MDKIQRIKDLTNQLNVYRHEYYNLNKPSVSDSEYDKLYDELFNLEEETGFVLNNSPTITVGYEVISKLKKVEHPIPLKSLNKTKSIDEINQWRKNKDVLLMLKADGCFIANTKILMADGTTKRIKDVQIYDEVMTFNEKTHKIESSRVLNTFMNGKKPIKEWRKIHLYSHHTNNKDSVVATLSHKFFTPLGWKEVKDLKIGDEVYTYNNKITKSQLSALIGIGLGDGCAIQRKDNRFGIEYRYCKTNKSPFNMMYYRIINLFNDMYGKTKKYISGYGSEMLDCNINTIRDIPKELNNTDNILRAGYTFTEEILKYVDPLVLAIYYIDDGSRCPSQDDGYETPNIKTRCILNTHRHNTREVHRFSEFLKCFYGIDNIVHKAKETKTHGSGLIIQLSAEGTEKFFDLIASYIPPELRPLKLGLKDKWQNAKIIEWWNDIGGKGLIKSNIVAIDLYLQNNKKNKNILSYDLEIEKNHTYFANGFAVHNCTNEIIYENGLLIEGSTRGNSIVGELITHNCSTYKNLPREIPFKGFLRLAGEAVIHWNDFEEINSKLSDEDKYATPRNLVSGSCRQLNSKICSQRDVYFYAFGILECSEFLPDLKSEQFEWLNQLGFTTIYNTKIEGNEDISEYVNKMYQIAEENKIPIDGMVFTFNSTKYSKSLGETSHHPHHSLALKAKDEAQTSQLKDIEWSVGRTGVITPVAIFDTVLLDNTEVSRASVHNLSIIEDLELGINDTISIIKANMIIPQIEENFTRSNNLTIPNECPVCGGKTVIEKLNESKVLKCTNNNCAAKLLRKFSHFVSRDAMNIEGLSDQSILKFINLGWVKTFDDIYNLQQYKSQIIQLEGWGLKSYNKLINAIEKSRKVKLQNFIYALGIPQIGKGASRIIAEYFNDNWDAFEKSFIEGFDFTKLQDFGDITNQSLHRWFDDDNERKMWSKLTYLVEFVKEEKKEVVSTDNYFNGKKTYCTGTFANYKKKELQSLLESLGAEFASGYAKSLDYLIVGSVKGSSKVDKAKKDGIPVMTEDEFISIVGQG